MKLVIPVVLVLTLAGKSRADTCSFGQHQITVHDHKTVVSVLLSSPPTTRLHLSFDSVTGRHRELEWDPNVDPRLGQEIDLEPDVWTASPTIQDTQLQQGTTILILHANFDAFSGSGNALIATYGAVTNADVKLGLAKWPQPTLTFTCDAPRPSIDSLDFVAPSVPSSQRAFGASIPAPIAEVLSLLGEIAIERAKKGAMSLLKDKLVKPLCDENGGVSIAIIDSSQTGLMLPRTCELLALLALDDVLSSGKPVLRALRDDLRFTIAPAVIHCVGNGSPWSKLVTDALALVNRAIDQGSFTNLDTQSVLGLFGDLEPLLGAVPLQLTKTIRDKLKPLLETGLRAALFDLKDCEKAGDTAKCKKAVRRAADQLASNRRTELIEQIDNINGTAHLPDVVKQVMARTVFQSITGCGGSAEACAVYLLDDVHVHSIPDLVRLGARFLGANREKLLEAIESELREKIDSDQTLRDAASAACQGRLAIAIIKTCTRTSCGADRIESMLTSPHDYFAPDRELPASLCWSGDQYRPVEGEALGQLRDLVVQGLNMLAAVTAEKGRDRAVTAIRMFFTISRRAAGCGHADAAAAQRCARITDLEHLVVALLQEDFVAGLTAATHVIGTMKIALPPALKKGAQLVGSIAAYAKVYNETKDEDPKAARDARKKALESLIDSATDRRDRGGQWVVSLGSNVALSYTRSWAHENPTFDDAGIMTNPASSDLSKQIPWAPEVRIPLGVAIQRLPNNACLFDVCLGFHASLHIGDLGQFVAVGENGKVADVRWDSFVAPGGEIGFLLGDAHRAASLTFHAEYSPSLFPTSDGNAAGAFRCGFSLGYYVPFFDFN